MHNGYLKITIILYNLLRCITIAVFRHFLNVNYHGNLTTEEANAGDMRYICQINRNIRFYYTILTKNG